MCAALVCVLWVGCGGSGPGDESFDRTSLERREDLSESLANDLLKLSVAVRDRDRDHAAIERFVADTDPGHAVAGKRRRVPTPVVKWVLRPGLGRAEPGERRPRRGSWGNSSLFLDRFGGIDDARFKVVSAEFDDGADDRGAAKIKFFVVGRDGQGRREWLRGKAHIEVSRTGEDPWRLAIGLFELDSMASTLSRRGAVLGGGLARRCGHVVPALRRGTQRGLRLARRRRGRRQRRRADWIWLRAAWTRTTCTSIWATGRSATSARASLVKFAPIGSGVLFLDFDNDGDADLFFAAVGRQVLLENRFVPDGELRFWDVSEKAGVDREAVGFSAVAADVNGDGLTDIYVCSYNRYGTVMPNSWYEATNGTPNLLLLNRGDGTFDEAAAEWGVADSRWSYAAGFVDIDEDGDQDLYVANDFGENALYRNDGDRFVDAAERSGVVDPGFGMGVSFGDYDNDGDLDLHVTNMSSTAGQPDPPAALPAGARDRRDAVPSRPPATASTPTRRRDVPRT